MTICYANLEVSTSRITIGTKTHVSNFACDGYLVIRCVYHCEDLSKEEIDDDCPSLIGFWFSKIEVYLWFKVKTYYNYNVSQNARYFDLKESKDNSISYDENWRFKQSLTLMLLKALILSIFGCFVVVP